MHASDTGKKKYTGIASQRPLGAAIIIYTVVALKITPVYNTY
jgi:hypothetical protein